MWKGKLIIQKIERMLDADTVFGSRQWAPLPAYIHCISCYASIEFSPSYVELQCCSLWCLSSMLANISKFGVHNSARETLWKSFNTFEVYVQDNSLTKDFWPLMLYKGTLQIWLCALVWQINLQGLTLVMRILIKTGEKYQNQGRF